MKQRNRTELLTLCTAAEVVHVTPLAILLAWERQELKCVYEGKWRRTKRSWVQEWARAHGR